MKTKIQTIYILAFLAGILLTVFVFAGFVFLEPKLNEKIKIEEKGLKIGENTIRISQYRMDMGEGPIKNLAEPTDNQDAATKSYVDAQAGGASSCPEEIEASDRSASTTAGAISTCRNLGNDWRLPTAEEISCFIGFAGVSSSLLWTRSPDYGSYLNWLTVRLTDGSWDTNYYTSSVPFRCVR